MHLSTSQTHSHFLPLLSYAMLRSLLLDHERAKKHYKRAMQLATSLAPQSFHFEDW